MKRESWKWSNWNLLLGVGFVEVLVIVESLTDPTFLPAVKQTPLLVAAALIGFGAAMYCIGWLFSWYSRIPKEPAPTISLLLQSAGFVAGAVLGILYGIRDLNWPIIAGLFTLLGGGLFSCVAVIIRAPRDAVRGACVGTILGIADWTIEFVRIWQAGGPIAVPRAWAIGFLGLASYATVGAVFAVYLLKILRFRKQASTFSESE